MNIYGILWDQSFININNIIYILYILYIYIIYIIYIYYILYYIFIIIYIYIFKGNAVIAHTIHVCNVDNNFMGRHYGSSAHCKENSRVPCAML